MENSIYYFKKDIYDYEILEYDAYIFRKDNQPMNKDDNYEFDNYEGSASYITKIGNRIGNLYSDYSILEKGIVKGKDIIIKDESYVFPLLNGKRNIDYNADYFVIELENS